MRRSCAFLVVLGALPLGGCVAGMAASAAGMAIRGAQGEPVSNSHLAREAVTACSDKAAEYGTVHIIDVEQRSASKLVVWGTADDGTQRRSFECGFGTRITGFKLRDIKS